MARFLRFQCPDGIFYGTMEGEELIHPISGDMFSDHTVSDKTYELKNVKLLPPCEPSKLLAIGFNIGKPV